MRWIWIDRIVELTAGQRCVAIKNVSLAEDVLHDHFPATDKRPAMPVLPNSLVIEGMAQTAGILVGHANRFEEKVILAKITHARFTDAAWPGHTIRYTAQLERIDQLGAATTGSIELIDPTGQNPARPMGQVDLLFSHLDRSNTTLDLPEHNFVFTGLFVDLLRQSGVEWPGGANPANHHHGT